MFFDPEKLYHCESHSSRYRRPIGAGRRFWHTCCDEGPPMIAALILVISGAMLVQFVVFFWRANMLAVASEPLSQSMSSAQRSFSGALNLNDFDSVTAMSQICPGVNLPRPELWPVRVYYRAVRAISRLSAAMPQANSWARREMACCTRYVAVSMDHCLQSNQAYVAALRGC
jgi:hypothetical protein